MPNRLKVDDKNMEETTTAMPATLSNIHSNCTTGHKVAYGNVLCSCCILFVHLSSIYNREWLGSRHIETKIAVLCGILIT